MKPVKIYSKDFCPYCEATKGFFQTLGISYQEIDVLAQENQREHRELAEKYHHYTVPLIFIGEEFVGGYDHLMALQKAGKLAALL